MRRGEKKTEMYKAINRFEAYEKAGKLYNTVKTSGVFELYEGIADINGAYESVKDGGILIADENITAKSTMEKFGHTDYRGPKPEREFPDEEKRLKEGE